MSEPLFSVVVPCHNCEATLATAVRSVLAQSCGDFELLLIDDGSSDSTLQLARMFARMDRRVRVLTQPNAGVAATRNRGVTCARGQLVAFLDADDWWAARKLASHRDLHAQQADLDASFARIRFVPQAAELSQTESSVPAGRLSVMRVLGENSVCTMSNLVVRRACFLRSDGFREHMSFAEDQEWLTRIIASGAQVAGVDRLLVYYRTSQAGLSSQLERMYAGWRSFAYDYAAPDQLRQSEAVYCRYLARRALRLPGPAHTALGYTVRGLRLSSRAFLADRKRGFATAIGATLAPLLPLTLRQKIFA